MTPAMVAAASSGPAGRASKSGYARVVCYLAGLATCFFRAREAAILVERYAQLPDRRLAELGLSREGVREALLAVLHGAR